jgi:replicative DNA helicase
MAYKRLPSGEWVKEGSTPAKPTPPAAVRRDVAVAKQTDRIKRGPAPAKIVEPPNDPEVEQAVLGSMMVEKEAIDVALQLLTPQKMYNEQHRMIFKAIQRIHERGVAVDVVLLASELRSKNELDSVGGGAYLADCINRVTTAAHVGYYAKKVLALCLDREIIKACGEMAVTPSAEGLDRLRKIHLERESIDSPMMFDYQVGMKGVLDQILKPENARRFQTHYPSIDAAWHGMKAGELNVWGGATNEGKSLLLLNLLDRSAEAGERCLYVGTEMEAIETVERHLSIQSNVEAWKIRVPKIEGQDLTKLRTAVKDMANMSINILDDPEPNLAKIEAAIHASKSEVVFLDYLERFELPRADQLRLQIKEFMRKLKTLARRTDTVIHLAAQLNRDTYGAEQRPPTLADLSESSAIEKEADRVGLLWTPPDARSGKAGAKPSSATPGIGEHCRMVQIINAKSRHCPKGFTFDFVLNSINLKIQEAGEYNDPFNHPI